MESLSASPRESSESEKSRVWLNCEARVSTSGRFGAPLLPTDKPSRENTRTA